MDQDTVSRALVVDDDQAMLGLLDECLKTRGLNTRTARTGDEALRVMRDWAPDFVLMDVLLPGLSGLDVLAAVRHQRLDTAVILTTGVGSEEVAMAALRLGADDYIPKPFTLLDLESVVERTISRLQLKRDNAALTRRLAVQRAELDRELARAAEVQADLLPSILPDIPGFDVAAACRPALDVGGDFYDWQLTPSGLLSLSIGDVMGKGISAALLMATVRAVLRALGAENAPARAIQRAARALEGDLTRSGSFITLFHAQLDVRSGRLRYVDAGHGYVVLRRENGRIQQLKPWGLPLGIDASEIYKEGTVQLREGDTLVVYSDGLAEARPDLFSKPRAVAEHAARCANASALVNHFVECATKTSPLPDDLTIVALRREAAVTANVPNFALADVSKEERDQATAA